MSVKKFFALIFLLLFSVLMFSCTGGTADISGTDTAVSDTVSAPEFASASEAKRALVALADGDFYKSMYTETWYTEYRNIISDVNSLVISPPDDEETCISACQELYARLSLHIQNAEYLRRDVPAVYIFTPYTIGREEYVNATVRIIDSADGEYGDMSGEITIRVRGNSTSVADKKPYNIKFAEKTSVLGMTEGRKWCLIANHYDKTLMRNKLAFHLSELCGDIYAIQSRYCDVYLNGTLQGNYLICQPVSDGVLDINTQSGDFIVERIVLLEGENDFHLSENAGYVFDSPEREEMSEEFRREIIGFMKKADSAIISGNQSEIESLIDIDSFVSAYLVHELLKDCDIVTGSTYFYRKNGILYAGPVWDMDLSSGNVSHFYDQDKYRIYNNVNGFGDSSGDSALGIWAQQEWFSYLMKCSFFSDAVKEKYLSLSAEIQKLYKDNGYIDTLCTEYGGSFSRNYNEAGWSVSIPYCDYENESPENTFDGNVNYLKEWLSRRDEYLRGYFGIK